MGRPRIPTSELVGGHIWHEQPGLLKFNSILVPVKHHRNRMQRVRFIISMHPTSTTDHSLYHSL